MEIALNRGDRIPIREQLARQIELKILGGEIRNGARLPSVRALARRLRVHPNTVSEAYRSLEGAGHVLLHRGAGVFVKGSGPTKIDDARDLDEMIRLALDLAMQKGYSTTAVKSAVERWIQAASPRRIVCVDPWPAMAEILVQEIRSRVSVPVVASTLAALDAQRRAFSDALIVCLPYHVERVKTLVPGGLAETVTVEASDAERRAVRALPAGSLVLIVSHAESVLPFARVFVAGLRGDEVHVETRPLADQDECARLVPSADLVFADAVSAPALGRWRPKRIHEFRIVSDEAVARIVKALGRPVVGC